eukprot:CAMPEP_0170585478 /NCGR_PEP_ID=MMETSP0224-20130122/9235_1 /TAXON_ID=285029 /ORGANISM="Togula jolla, Strain CCCM 725" /LENGTH=530 /DNA_ID=CAMNT_0010908965 /DNA_START=17 /DNA_END=1606 /DNA_ORIENTATION=+
MTGDSIYCVCEVKRSDRKAKPTKCETKYGTSLNPVWDETHSLEPWQEGEAIEFTLYNKGLIRSKIEGTVTVGSHQFYPAGLEAELPISGLPNATLTVAIVPVFSNNAVACEPALAPAPAQTSPIEDLGGAGRVEVGIVRALGLHRLNMSGNALYCVCEVKSEKKDKAKTSKCETKTVRNTLDPVWDEKHTLDWKPGEALEFLIYDKGLISSKTEGKVVLASEKFYPSGFEGEVPIEGLPSATLYVHILPRIGNNDNNVQVQEELKASAATPVPLHTQPLREGQKLQVSILQASGFGHLNSSGNGLCCACETIGTAASSKKETKVVSSGPNPVWNETFQLDLWQPGEPLEFTILDKGISGSKTEGKVSLPSHQFYPSGFEGNLQIEGLPGATLHVRILLGDAPGPTSPTSRLSLPAAEEQAARSSAGEQLVSNLDSKLTPAIPASPSAAKPELIHAEGPLQKLQVSIVSAVGLKHMNMTGDALFCVCEVKHADKRAKAATCTTATVGKTLEPTWNETHEIDPWCMGEPLEF